MSARFTDEELAIAKSVDLTAVAAALGYSVQRIGRYHTLKEMDSIRIYDRTHWYRWSKQKGGSQIDFLMEFANMDVKEAVWWLLDFAGYYRKQDSAEPRQIAQPVATRNIITEAKPEQRREFILPPKASDNSRIIDYLCNERCISRAVVDFFIRQGLIYESRPYHNVVFVGKDKSGTAKFASMRGIYDKGKPFKCDVTGSDKSYGFNLVSEGSTELIVFEAAIDLMSYIDIRPDYDAHLLALGMLSDAPIKTFLREHPEIIRIKSCLDADEPGRNAAKILVGKYKCLGYETEDCPPPAGYKDYNEWLVASKSRVEFSSRARIACL